MDSLLQTLLSKRSASRLFLSDFLNIQSNIRNFQDAVAKAEADTSGLPWDQISYAYDNYYEIIKNSLGACKDVIEEILITTTRAGTLEAFDFQGSMTQFFTTLRSIIVISDDTWSAVMQDLAFIQNTLTNLTNDLSVSVQEAYTTLFNISYMSAKLQELAEYLASRGYAELLLVLKKWIGLLGFLEQTIPAPTLGLASGLDLATLLKENTYKFVFDN